MTESVTIPGKETMKDHVKPNGPIPSDTPSARGTPKPENERPGRKPDHDAGNPPDHERERLDHPDGTARGP